MNLEQLRAKRNELAEKMKKLADEAKAGKDGMNAEQEKAFDEAFAEFEKLDAQIKRLERLEGVEKRLGALRPSVGQEQLTSGAARPGGPEAKKEFESFGEFMHAVRFRSSDQRLEWHDQPAELRGENRMDDGPSGGFMVPTQFRGELLSVEQSPAAVRPRATVIPAGSPPDAELAMPALDQGSAENMYGGVVVDWIGEGGTKPETDARVKEVRLKPHEVAAHITVTDKLLRNWQAGGPLLSMLLRRAIGAAEDDAFINGSGVAKPKGFLKSGCAIAVNRTTALTVKYADVVAMEGALLADAIPVWLTTRRTAEKLRLMEDTEGHLIWTSGNAVEARPPSLLGYPVAYVPRMPQRGAKGDLALVDLRYYLIKDGSGPFVQASEHVKFTQNKTVIKAFWNVDGATWLNEAVKEENGDTQSPIIVLDVPAV